MTSLPAVLRSAAAAVTLLSLASILTGCGPENGEQFLPYTHNVNTSYEQQPIAPPEGPRHHKHAPRAFQEKHHTQPPQGLSAIN